MRSRNIKPGFFKNEDLAEVEPLGRLLFAGLWCLADREGRLEDRPKKIKAEILPYEDAPVEPLLEALARRGFIRRYRAEGVAYIAIPAFRRHQNPHHREAPSRIPGPRFDTNLGAGPGFDPNPGAGPGIGPSSSGTGPADTLIPDCRIPDCGLRKTDSAAEDLAPEPLRPASSASAASSASTATAGGNEPSERDLAELAAFYLRLTGRPRIKAGEEAAMREALAGAGDLSLVKRAVEAAYRRYQPEFAADKIRSFKYFLPVIAEVTAAARRVRAPDLPPEGARPREAGFDRTESERLTAELLKLLPEFAGEGVGNGKRE